MNKANRSKRLQLIREVAIRVQLASHHDEMSNHISHLLDSNSHANELDEFDRSQFTGCHYDEDIGGWISNEWQDK